MRSCASANLIISKLSGLAMHIKLLRIEKRAALLMLLHFTSSTAQGGGGSFKNRKPIGEVGCCESGMAKRIH